MNNKLFNMLILVALTVFAAACGDDDSPQPITINFTNQDAGISSTSVSADVTIAFSRAASGDGEIQLAVNSNDLTYGSDADFYTEPAAVNNVLTLPYSAGDESIGFTVFSGPTLNIQEDKNITIALNDSNGNLALGENTSVTITFSENFVAPSGTVELNAGGEEFPLQSFVDLSKLTQTTVDKFSWDLGFYAAAGEHYVIVNSSAFYMARPIDKNDLNEVTAEDTVSFAYEMQVPPPGFNAEIGSVNWVDSPDGNLETSSFGAISATDSENKVFIIKRNGDWKKVRVLQNGDNYTLQYANIGATSFETVDITKDEAYNFIFFNFENGEVEVEPAKDAWDIMYGTYTEAVNFGGLIPYGYNDFIIINRNSTEVAMVMITADVDYETFGAEDISGLEFNTEIDALGENWRQGGGPTSDPSLFTDRFFVLEDSEGSVFKIKFTQLTTIDGERGYPEFTFERIQ